MRILKIIGIVMSALIMAFLVLGLITPNQITVERSTTISASSSAIFPYLMYLEKQDLWSPWMELDPNIKQSFTGTDGTVGAIITWEGNSDVGKGEREITLIEDMKRVDTKIRFIEPWTSEADAVMRMEESEEGVKVSWSFETEAGFPSNAFFMLMGMEGAIGADYDKGLAKLKSIVEEEAAKPYRLGEIKASQADKKLFVGVRAIKKMDEMQAFFAEVFGKLFGILQEKGVEMAGMPSALYFTWEPEKQQSDMAAVIPVKEAVNLGEEYEMFEIPAAKLLSMNYYGSYDGLGVAHEAFDAYISEHGLTQKTPVAEEYVSDPGTEPDQNKWLTKIFYWVE